MSYGIRLLVLLLGLLPTSWLLAAEDRSCAEFRQFANPELLVALQRGVNLPGWDLENAGDRPQTQQLRALRTNDFRHIRLPVDNRRLDASGDYIGDLYDQTITLLSLGFAVSIDLHPDDEIGRLARQDPAKAEAYLNRLWDKMLPMIRTLDPKRVAVELLNEPQIDQEPWMAMAKRLIARIRLLLPAHTIIVGPSGPQRHEMLSGMQPFDDDNIVYAVHYYDPFLFTHQGANWGADNDPLRDLAGLPFPARASDKAVSDLRAKLAASGRRQAVAEIDNALQGDWNEAMIASAFSVMRDWSNRHKRPVIINEFGVLNFVAPRASRLRWLQAVNRQAASRCLGWTHWDFQDGFGLIDPATKLPDPEIMRALSPAD